MYNNGDLHSFLLEKAKQLTEDWYNQLDKSDSKGVYSSRNPEVIKMLKQQNYEFNLPLWKGFIEKKKLFAWLKESLTRGKWKIIFKPPEKDIPPVFNSQI